MVTKPYFYTIKNPVKGADFTHFEIQTVREYQQPGGDPFWEVVTDLEHCAADCPEAIGPVMYGVYGRLEWGGADHIVDYLEHKFAAELLFSITKVTIPPI